MAEVVGGALPLPAGAEVGVVAYGLNGEAMAACSGATVAVLRRSPAAAADAPGAAGWEEEGAFEAVAGGGAVVLAAWAHHEFGEVLATVAADGALRFWENLGPGQARAPGAAAPRLLRGAGRWVLLAQARVSAEAVRCIAFAPPQHGLRLAAGSDDGAMRVFEGKPVFHPTAWAVAHQFQPKAGAGCVSLAWRPVGDPGLPAMMLVGTTAGAFVCAFDGRRAKWAAVAEVPLAEGTVVADVHWAPATGRAHELAALAVSNWAVVLQLSGDPDALEVEKAAEFEHPAQVFQVEWNLTGTALATSAADGQGRIWKEDALGKWGLAATIETGE